MGMHLSWTLVALLVTIVFIAALTSPHTQAVEAYMEAEDDPNESRKSELCRSIVCGSQADPICFRECTQTLKPFPACKTDYPRTVDATWLSWGENVENGRSQKCLHLKAPAR